LARIALRTKQLAKSDLGDSNDDDQGSQRTQTVREVSQAELPAARKRGAKREPLDERRWHGESDECEPRDSGQDENGA
jgi:hypothetical protein